MNVITANPLVINKSKISTRDMYIALDGEPTDAAKAKAAKRGVKWDKRKGWIKKASDFGQKTGATDLIKSKLSEKLGLNQGGQTTTVDLAPPTPTEEPKMSMKKKVLIGVGAALIIGTIIFLATRKKATSLKTA